MHEVGAIHVGGGDKDEVGPHREVENIFKGDSVVGSKEGFCVGGPNIGGSCSFPNVTSGRAQRMVKLGPKVRSGRPCGNRVCSPSDLRPMKRVRCDEKEVEPGFGFIGFTDRASGSSEEQSLFEAQVVEGFDLNVNAIPDPPVSDGSVDPVPVGSNIGHPQMPVSNPCPQLEKEVENTVSIGVKLGVNFQNHVVRRSVVSSGIGGVHKPGWISSIRRDFGVNFIAIQESKQSNICRSEVSKFWGKGRFGLESVDASGLSGGLICLWDEDIFKMTESNKHRNYLHVRGTISGSNVTINFLNIYAPQGIPAKKELWDSLLELINSYDGRWILGGDFNAVRFRDERRNCSFKPPCANNFNSFIFGAGLVEYNLSGSPFTWRSENGKKLSKLDRFLVNSEFLNDWPEACVQALPRMWSDHCPIVMVTKSVNFGAKPFRIFNSWMGKDGFAEVVHEACLSFSSPDCPPDIFLVKKLGFICGRIREWRDKMLKKESEDLSSALEEIADMESILVYRDLLEEEEWILAENKKTVAEMEYAKAMDLRQRSRLRWAKEGDENSSFFHSMINCRKASNVIHGLQVGGVWVDKLSLIKKEVFKFFRSKFVEDCVNRPSFSCSNLKKISDSDDVAGGSVFDGRN
ncbi:putative endonuclease/exonuclease/phosphatase [Helianthus annuus]|nr:putative endonuclease/exonuclease/phosphatase [Helianthus annuus]